MVLLYLRYQIKTAFCFRVCVPANDHDIPFLVPVLWIDCLGQNVMKVKGERFTVYFHSGFETYVWPLIPYLCIDKVILLGDFRLLYKTFALTCAYLSDGLSLQRFTFVRAMILMILTVATAEYIILTAWMFTGFQNT